MKLLDYTGKLNTHQEYLDILDKIEPKCQYIEIVITFGNKSNDIVENFKDDILESRKVSEWWGTITKGKNNLYKIKSSKKLFDYLKQYETFCKYYFYGSNAETLSRGDYSEITDFGSDDIAFYDKNNNLLLFTTTHEGYITINEIIL